MAQADLLLDPVGAPAPGDQTLLRKVYHAVITEGRPRQTLGLEEGRQPWDRVPDLLRRQGRRTADA